MGQLRLEDAETSAAGRRRRPRGDALDRLGAGLLYWAPVWLPTILFVQLALGGLKPALAETRRLDRAEQEVERWEDELAGQLEVVRRHRRMLSDDVYRERVRRSLRTGDGPLLLHAGE